MHTVGKINREIYRCITEDISTDEVVITDERIRHIKERHPKDYAEVIRYMTQVIQEPDYILQDEVDNTGLVIKTSKNDQNSIQVILRIHTAKDKDRHKNSIISGWKISDKRLQNYLRNKVILYKKE